MNRRDRPLKRFCTGIQKNFSFPLVITAIIVGGLLVSCGNNEEIREGMSQYLEKTYETEFVVEKPYKRDLGFFGYDYEAKVHRKDNPKVKFTIRGDRDNSGHYVESYLSALWSYQGRQEVDKSLRELYGEDYFLDRYSFGYDNPKYKRMNYSDVIIKCDGHAFINMEYYVFVRGNINKKREAEKIYEILKKYMIDNKVEKYFLNVYYLSDFYKMNPSSYRDEFKKILYISEIEDIEDELHKGGKLMNFIVLHSLKIEKNELKAKTISDIITKFKY